MSRRAGFTLIEMMIAIAVTAVLVAIGIPRFQTVIQNNRITTVNNELVSALSLARSEAIKRGAPVRVSPLGGGWSAGWRVWVDVDDDGAFTGTDTELRQHAELPLDVRLSVSVADFVFLANGRVTQGGDAQICDGRAGNFGRAVDVGATGRVRSSQAGCP